MKSKILLTVLVATWSLTTYAQRYVSDKSTVSFFSSAPIEDIDSENTKSSSAFNIETGEVVFSIPINQFEFDKSLMKEHFNEKYMESETYPKSTFSGKIEGYEDKSGQQQATAKGKLTIHGMTKEVEIEGTFEKKEDRIFMNSSFVVALEDYDIEIPQLLWQNIAEKIEVKIAFEYKKYE